MSHKEKLIVFGASGHGKVVIDIVEQQGEYEIAGFVDDDVTRKGSDFFGYPILGTRTDLPSLKSEQLHHIIVAIGSNSIRASLAPLLEDQGWSFAKAIHPRACIGRGVEIRPGSVIMAHSTINSDSFVGSHVIVNTGACIDHDCRIGDGAHIAPGCFICGHVCVGQGSFLGVGTNVIPGVRIGKAVTVGAGSTVIEDIPDGVRVAGVPARRLDQA